MVEALIAGGSNLLGGAMDAFFTARENKRSQNWARQMYNRQYKDNIDFWNMQNQYNTPAAQMQRFRDAGLNPNLIYGRGSSGNADKISSPTPMTPQFRAPEVGSAISSAGMNFINTMYDLDIKAAQRDNLLEDNKIKKEQAANVAIDTARKAFDLGFERDHVSYSSEARKEGVRQQRVATDYILSKDQREAALNESNLKEAASRVLRMEKQNARDDKEMKRIDAAIRALNADSTLKELDVWLWDQGITRSDPMWMRMLQMYLKSLDTNFKFKNFFKY